jgi:Flp pilus assembly protein TadD
VNQQPNFAPAHNLLGVAYAQRGDATAAIAQFRKALELDPGLSDAQTNLDLALGSKH